MKWFVFIGLAVVAFAQTAQVRPSKMHRLEMLAGEWRVPDGGGRVEFYYDMTRGMVGRARPDNSAQWRRMMLIHPYGGDVVAEFYPVDGEPVHYRLDLADGHALEFAEISGPRRIVYQRDGPERISYRFESGNRVTDSGTLVLTAELRPLSE